MNWARQVPSVYGYKLSYKVLWLKPDKHYVTWKGSRLTSAQSYITGLYSVRYSPLHIINSWLYHYLVCIIRNSNFDCSLLQTVIVVYCRL